MEVGLGLEHRRWAASPLPSPSTPQEIEEECRHLYVTATSTVCDRHIYAQRTRFITQSIPAQLRKLPLVTSPIPISRCARHDETAHRSESEGSRDMELNIGVRACE